MEMINIEEPCRLDRLYLPENQNMIVPDYYCCRTHHMAFEKEWQFFEHEERIKQGLEKRNIYRQFEK